MQGLINFISSDFIVHEVQPAHIKAYFQLCREQGLTAHSLHAKHRTIVAFFNWCKRENYCSDNPVKILRTKVPTKVMHILTEQDFLAILKVCSNKRDKAIFLVLWDTGMRLGESTQDRRLPCDWQVG